MSIQLNDVLNNISKGETKYDPVDNPRHYDYPIAPLEYCKPIICNMDGVEGACVKDIIKYVSRFNRKNGVEDLKKARYYLNELIDYKEEKQND